jgi:serine/threonine-protein kinase
VPEVRHGAGDVRDDEIVTAGALQQWIGIAVLRDGPSAPSARHREGIVHGDVEPSSLMLRRAGNAKLIDIGAACAREDARPRSARVPPVARGSPHSPPARDGNPKGRR